MSDTAEIHVALQPAVADMVQQAVDAGEYASLEEVVREALLEWHLRRTLNPAETDTLCQLWDAGIGSGAGQFRDMNELVREARRRWAEEPLAKTG